MAEHPEQQIVPDSLVEAIIANACVVFIGAGLASVANIPVWSNLSDSMSKIMSCPEDMDPLLLAECFEASYGRSELRNFLIREIEGKTVEIPAAYQALVQIPLRTYITTNYDKLLEKSFEAAGRQFTGVGLDGGMGKWTPGRGVVLLKMHGDLDGQFVFTERDYQNYARNYPAMVSTLLHLLSTHTFLFIGCSLADPNFRWVYHRALAASKTESRHHFVVRTEINPHLDKIWSRLHIDTIDISTLGYSHSERTETFLRALKSLTLTKSTDLRERHAIFCRDEQRYCNSVGLMKRLIVRKDSGLSFLATPDQTEQNPFAGCEEAERRFETAIERKTTYRRYLASGSTIKLIVTVSAGYLRSKGYLGLTGRWRLEALASFIRNHMNDERLQIALREFPIGDIEYTCYNEDACIQSLRVSGYGRGDDHCVVVREPEVVRQMVAMFDTNFSRLLEFNMKEVGHEPGVSAENQIVIVKQLVLTRIAGILEEDDH